MSKPSLNPTVVHETLDKHIEAGKPFDGWEELWAKDDPAHRPWDKAVPHPALEEILTSKRSVIGGSLLGTTLTTSQGSENESRRKRKKALVPGCGRGVDVLLLASFGYDAYGLEYSRSAIEVCREEERRAVEDEGRYPVKGEGSEIGRGRVTWVEGDFFQDDWLGKLGFGRNCFDLVYDYTFLCALNPSMRPAWAMRYTQLVAPSPQGNLVCLEFPRHKDPSLRGPPWSCSSQVYMEHLSHPGENIAYDAQGRCISEPLRRPSELGLERVAYWQPARTHDVGMSQEGEVFDRVSIWRLR